MAKGGRKMRKEFAVLAVAGLTLGLMAVLGSAQADKSKRPSPPAQATFSFGEGKTITVDYSSPRVKGRKIFGEHEPYGKVWRAGANEATTFVTTSDLMVGGTHVPAGSYTIFAIPNKDKWTLVISKKTGEWGTAYPGPSEDLARIDMKVFGAASSGRKFHDCVRQGSEGLPSHDGVGNHAGVRGHIEDVTAYFRKNQKARSAIRARLFDFCSTRQI